MNIKHGQIFLLSARHLHESETFLFTQSPNFHWVNTLKHCSSIGHTKWACLKRLTPHETCFCGAYREEYFLQVSIISHLFSDYYIYFEGCLEVRCVNKWTAASYKQEGPVKTCTMSLIWKQTQNEVAMHFKHREKWCSRFWGGGEFSLWLAVK